MDIVMHAFSNNFAKILGILGVALRDRRPADDRILVWATHIDHPAQMLASGELALAFYTPPWVGLMDMEGKGFAEGMPPVPGLRAIASFPHFDQYAFAVRKDLGIKSFSEFIAYSNPLKISLHFAGKRFMEAIFGVYDADANDFERRGGRWVQLEYATWQKGWVPLIKSGELDGVFDEGLMTKRWQRVAEEVDLEFLPLDGPQLDQLAAYGMKKGTLPQGRLRGVDRDLPTIDMEGWVLVCHEQLDEELAFLITQTLDEMRPTIDASFSPGQGLTGPFADHPMWERTDIPLHTGAERYYRQKGYL